MRKLLIIFIAAVNFSYATHTCLYRDDSEDIQLETQQTITGIYVSQVNITNRQDSCFVNLNFDKQQGMCVAYGVNFCSYEMDGVGYRLSGLISYIDSAYPTGIELNGEIHQDGCTIKSFKSTELDLYSNC